MQWQHSLSCRTDPQLHSLTAELYPLERYYSWEELNIVGTSEHSENSDHPLPE